MNVVEIFSDHWSGFYRCTFHAKSYLQLNDRDFPSEIKEFTVAHLKQQLKAPLQRYINRNVEGRQWVTVAHSFIQNDKLLVQADVGCDGFCDAQLIHELIEKEIASGQVGNIITDTYGFDFQFKG